MTLFDTIAEVKERTIQESFERFHSANPQVYELFRDYAGRVRAKGHSKFSADAIIQRIRWEMNVEIVSVPGELFKVNDHYSSRYARLLIAEDASYRDFFELRQLKTL